MGYSEEDFKRDMRKAAQDAYKAVNVTSIDVDHMAPFLVPYYIGDKPCKRELQVLLDKFVALGSVSEMYVEDISSIAVNKECKYTQKAKSLIVLLEAKCNFVNYEGLQIDFNITKKLLNTKEFVKNMQILIDVM